VSRDSLASSTASCSTKNDCRTAGPDGQSAGFCVFHPCRGDFFCAFACDQVACGSGGSFCPVCQRCAGGLCGPDPDQVGDFCDDRNVCTTGTTCQAGGFCGGGVVTLCPSGTCDPSTGCD
jgi:hypothetical protein